MLKFAFLRIIWELLKTEKKKTKRRSTTLLWIWGKENLTDRTEVQKDSRQHLNNI